MVVCTADFNGHMPHIPQDCGDIGIDIAPDCRQKHRLAIFYRKYKLEEYLGICIGHRLEYPVFRSLASEAEPGKSGGNGEASGRNRREAERQPKSSKEKAGIEGAVCRFRRESPERVEPSPRGLGVLR